MRRGKGHVRGGVALRAPGASRTEAADSSSPARVGPSCRAHAGYRGGEHASRAMNYPAAPRCRSRAPFSTGAHAWAAARTAPTVWRCSSGSTVATGPHGMRQRFWQTPRSSQGGRWPRGSMISATNGSASLWEGCFPALGMRMRFAPPGACRAATCGVPGSPCSSILRAETAIPATACLSRTFPSCAISSRRTEQRCAMRWRACSSPLLRADRGLPSASGAFVPILRRQMGRSAILYLFA